MWEKLLEEGVKDGSGSRKLIIPIREHFKGLIKFCMCASACERQWLNLVSANTQPFIACSMGTGSLGTRAGQGTGSLLRNSFRTDLRGSKLQKLLGSTPPRPL